MTVGTGARDNILDAVFNATAYSETAIYCSLHTADPGATGANEVTGGSYGRQTVTTSFAAASGGSVDSNADIEFANMPAATVTHVGIWDAASSGNYLWGGALDSSEVVPSGATFRLASGNLSATLT